jgi:hypothetical protein
MKAIKILKISIFIFSLGMMNSCIIGPDPVDTIDHFVLYPKDKSQAITVITKGDIRYIINGSHNRLPDTNYIKIDISQIDPVGDEIGVCWNKSKYRWEAVNHNSRIIENKLDTSQFKFNISWEVDDRGIPNSAKYHQDMCGSTGTDSFAPLKGDDLIFEEK